MHLSRKIKNVIRGLKQRWGSPAIKRHIWDNEYAGGQWDHCDHTPDAFIYEYVYRYCRQGSVLDLGCGSGNTGNEMSPNHYAEYIGVDISEVAILKAAARSASLGRGKKNRYLQGDILDYTPAQRHDVILFRESIYYVPLLRIKSVLERYSEYLNAQGGFVVHVSGTKPAKAQQILAIIEKHFEVLEKSSPNNRGDFVVVFRRRH